MQEQRQAVGHTHGGILGGRSLYLHKYNFLHLNIYMFHQKIVAYKLNLREESNENSQNDARVGLCYGNRNRRKCAGG